MPESKPRVVVIGGGIAGLASGFLVREQTRERGIEIDLTVLEAKEQPGGNTRTDHINGYTCEWGPNGFLDNEPATLDLVERIGLTDQLVKADDNSSNRYIYHGGRMRRVPVKPPAFLISDILPIHAKLRMALELLIPAKRNGSDETVDAFGRRRLGVHFADFMLDPMVSGIFAGNTKKLSLAAVFPKMVEMESEYGGLFRAMIAKQKETKRKGTASGGPGGPNAVLHTFKQGMGQLTAHLTDLLVENVQLNSSVQSIIRTEDRRFRIIIGNRLIDADAVIVAAPSYAAAEMIRDIDTVTSDTLAAIEHAPVSVVCHGHPQDHLSDPLQGFGVLIPRSEGIRSLGSLWSDAIFPGQAPDGYRLLRTIMGGAHDSDIKDLSSEKLHAIASADHNRVQGVFGEPSLKTEFRFDNGIAQYTVGHQNRVKRSEQLENDLPGLYFTGASYRGVSINGCAKDAKRVADALTDRVTTMRGEAGA
jgi:protoporphyrinogen/coproporphyrinogen III oxidase